jgi:hypothetical protein
MAHFCAVSNEDIITPVVDYGHDYPAGSGRVLGEVTYAQLMSGKISLDGQEVPTVPLSSMVRAREVANILKEWISSGRFLLGEPVELLPSGETPAGPGRGEPGELKPWGRLPAGPRRLTILLHRIIRHLQALPRVLLLLSGGVDSGLLLALGRRPWGRGSRP